MEKVPKGFIHLNNSIMAKDQQESCSDVFLTRCGAASGFAKLILHFVEICRQHVKVCCKSFVNNI